MAKKLNCLPESVEDVDALIRESGVSGFEISFCFDNGGNTMTCDLAQAQFATIYLHNGYGEAMAIHNVYFTDAGVDEMVSAVRECFAAVVKVKSAFRKSTRILT